MSATLLPGVIGQAATALANLTLVSPILTPTYGPINQVGESLGSALQFDYEGENVVELQSEITDEFIETNSSVADHIALKPEKITVHGFKGEVGYLFPSFVPPATQVQAILGAIGQFAPGFSQSALNVINEVNQAYTAVTNAVNGAVSAWNSINGGSPQTVIGASGISAQGNNQNKQQLLFSQFYGYWSRQLAGQPPTLFTVQTPWAIFSPCAIEGMRSIQDEKTNTMTDFFITFKMIRFVNTNVQNNFLTGRALSQYAPINNNGAASLTLAPDVVAQANASGLSLGGI